MEYGLQITTAALHITVLVLNMANNTLYEGKRGRAGEGEGRGGEGRGGEGEGE